MAIREQVLISPEIFEGFSFSEEPEQDGAVKSRTKPGFVLSEAYPEERQPVKVHDRALRVVDPALVDYLLEGHKLFELEEQVGNHEYPVRKGAKDLGRGEKTLLYISQLVWRQGQLLALGMSLSYNSGDGNTYSERLLLPLKSLTNLRPIKSERFEQVAAASPIDLEYVATQPEEVFLDDEKGLVTAISSLEQYGIALVDFGSTWGIVFRTDARELVAGLRGERKDRNVPLPWASLVTSMATIKEIVPQTKQPGTVIGHDDVMELIEIFKGVGFVRFTPDLSSQSQLTINNLTRHFINQDGQLQIYPLSHPLFEAWALKHPEDPFLGVRSANTTKSQEQALPTGGFRLAQLMGIPVMAYLSPFHRSIQFSDEEKLALPTDKLGLHVGTYDRTNTMRGRHGSVPIVTLQRTVIGPDSKVPLANWWSTDGEVTKRGGLVTQDVSLVCERIGNVSPEALLRLISWYCKKHQIVGAINTGATRDYRTTFAPDKIELFREVPNDNEIQELTILLAQAALWFASES